jgi:DnaJ-class molecular chaperone
MIQCPDCKGKGTVLYAQRNDRKPELCNRCGGATVIPFRSWNPKHTYEACPDCNGAGFVGGRSEFRNGSVVTMLRGDECTRCCGDGLIATRIPDGS